jgi:hypothetical protein
VAADPVSSCATLDVPHTTHQLSGDIFAGNANFSCFFITADNITLDGGGFRVSGVPKPHPAIAVQGASSIVIQNFFLSDVYIGIQIYSCAHCTVRNNTISGEHGITAASGANNLIDANTINSYQGSSSMIGAIEVIGETNVSVTNNNIGPYQPAQALTGISLIQCGGGSVAHNSFSEISSVSSPVTGIYAHSSTNTHILQNTVSTVTGSAIILGIRVESSAGEISYNHINNLDSPDLVYGISVIYDDEDFSIYGNVISSLTSSGASVFGVNVLGNSTAVSVAVTSYCVANNVSNIVSTGCFTVASGIYISRFTTNFVISTNNIDHVQATGSCVAEGVYGIFAYKYSTSALYSSLQFKLHDNVVTNIVGADDGSNIHSTYLTMRGIYVSVDGKIMSNGATSSSVFVWGTTISNLFSPVIKSDANNSIIFVGSLGDAAFVRAINSAGSLVYHSLIRKTGVSLVPTMAVLVQGRLYVASEGGHLFYRAADSSIVWINTQFDKQGITKSINGITALDSLNNTLLVGATDEDGFPVLLTFALDGAMVRSDSFSQGSISGIATDCGRGVAYMALTNFIASTVTLYSIQVPSFAVSISSINSYYPFTSLYMFVAPTQQQLVIVGNDYNNNSASNATTTLSVLYFDANGNIIGNNETQFALTRGSFLFSSPYPVSASSAPQFVVPEPHLVPNSPSVPETFLLFTFLANSSVGSLFQGGSFAGFPVSFPSNDFLSAITDVGFQEKSLNFFTLGKVSSGAFITVQYHADASSVDAPQIFDAIEYALVYWQRPAVSDLARVNYTLQMSPSSSGPWSTLYDGTDPFFAAYGLTRGGTYFFRVSASYSLDGSQVVLPFSSDASATLSRQAPPQVYKIDPSSMFFDKSKNFMIITVTGSNFSTDSICILDNQPVPTIYNSSSTIYCNYSILEPTVSFISVANDGLPQPYGAYFINTEYSPNLVVQATVDSINVSWEASTQFSASSYEVELLFGQEWVMIYNGTETQFLYEHLLPSKTYSLRFRARSVTDTPYLTYQSKTSTENFFYVDMWDNYNLDTVAIDFENSKIYTVGTDFAATFDGSSFAAANDLAGNFLDRTGTAALTEPLCSNEGLNTSDVYVVVGKCGADLCACTFSVQNTSGAYSCVMLLPPAGLSNCVGVFQDDAGNLLVFGNFNSVATVFVVPSSGNMVALSVPTTNNSVLTGVKQSPSAAYFYASGSSFDGSGAVTSNFVLRVARTSGSVYEIASYEQWSGNSVELTDVLFSADASKIAFLGLGTGGVNIYTFSLNSTGDILPGSLASTNFSGGSFYNISQTIFYPLWTAQFPEVVVSGQVTAGNAFPGFSPSGNNDVFVGYLSGGNIANVSQYGTEYNDEVKYSYMDRKTLQLFVFVASFSHATDQAYALSFRRYFPAVIIDTPIFTFNATSPTNMEAQVQWNQAVIPSLYAVFTYQLEIAPVNSTDENHPPPPPEDWRAVYTGTETGAVVQNLSQLTNYTSRLIATYAGSKGISASAFTVPDIDECQFDVCDPLANCTNLVGSYECGPCPSGYVGSGNTSCEIVCTEDKAVRCKNQTCVHSVAECRVVTCSNSTFTCATGECVDSFLSCPQKTCINTTCWDGTCASSLDQCESLTECPPLTQRCPDGTCKTSCQTTCANGMQVCANGYCGYCGPFYGCPAYVPYLCANGTCVSDLKLCKTCATGSLCFDGSCSMTCPKSPRLVRPISFSVVLPVANETAPKLPISVLSNDLQKIVEVILPDSLLPNATNTSTMLFVDPVPDSSIVNVNGFNVTTWNSFASNIMSSVLSLRLSVNNTQNITSNFTEPVKITFFNSLPPDTNVSDLCLAFVNETTNEWQCESNITISENGAIVGHTTHFTQFVVLGKVRAPTVNALDEDKFAKLSKVDKNSTGVYVVAGVFFAYLLGLMFTLRYDKRHAHANTGFDDRFGNLGGKHIEFTDFADDVADFKTPPTESSSSAGASSSASATTSSAPMDPSEPSTPRRKLGPSDSSKPRRKLSTTEKSVSYFKSTRSLFVEKFREKHSWLGLFFSRGGNRFERTERLTILLCMILGNLVINALFYDTASDVHLLQKVVIGLIVGSIVFPITIVLHLLLSRTHGKFRAAAYTIAILYTLVCGVLVIVYSLNFGTKKANAWLTSFAISTGQDFILNQPFKFLMSSFIVTCCPTSFIAHIL